MTISFSWLKKFIDLPESPEEISQVLTNIGLEVESLEKVESIKGGLQGLVVGHVLSCEQHPNADRLKVAQVDLGNGTPVQIVCGAPNVAAGQKVIVAPVGTTVHPLSGEAFKINKSKIRGEVSEGMICADDEIGLGTSHDGIKVLDANAQIGMPVRELFSIQDEVIFEIGLTPNRSDATSHLGVARDLGAYYKRKLKFDSHISGNLNSNSQDLINISVPDSQACPRYSGICLSNIEVKESPNWLQSDLKSIGIKPMNNIVDITNYICFHIGQPLHAFDLDKIKSKHIQVSTGHKGKSFKTLDGQDRKLFENDLMICDDFQPMCMAGVYGGMDSGVSAGTKNIFLESAYFNPVFVRKTSKNHGLKTDASFRFERGTDPQITIKALELAVQLLSETAGAKTSSKLYDVYPQAIENQKIFIDLKNIHRLIGKEIPKEEILSILKSLQIEILSDKGNDLEVSVPTYKVDVTREVDIVEEILRIYGYNNIEFPNQLKSSLSFSTKKSKESISENISNALTAQGFNEILTNSLTKGLYSDLLGEEQKANRVSILNPLSSELDVMKQHTLFTGLEVIAFNINRRAADLKFYEFSKTYATKEEGYKENAHLSLYLTGMAQGENWNSESNAINYYHLKGLVDKLLEKYQIRGFEFMEGNNDLFNYSSTYQRAGKILVEYGEVSKKTLKKLDIGQNVYFAQFNFDLFVKEAAKNKILFSDIPKFPMVRRDLSILLDKKIKFIDLKNEALKIDKKILKDIQIFDVYEGDKLPEGKKSYAMSYFIQDEEKTLTDKLVDGLMDKIIEKYEKGFSAEIRKS